MERIQDRKPSGLNSNALRAWGMAFLALGVVGRCILQNRLLCLGQVSPMELVEAMQNSGAVMVLATAALVLQAVETCAVPIFAFLLGVCVTMLLHVIRRRQQRQMHESDSKESDPKESGEHG